MAKSRKAELPKPRSLGIESRDWRLAEEGSGQTGRRKRLTRVPVRQEPLLIFQGGQRIGEMLTESGKVPVLLSLTAAPANPLLYERASGRLGGSTALRLCSKSSLLYLLKSLSSICSF